jgi:hypothetical protein
MKIESADRKASMEVSGDNVTIRSVGAATMLARGIQGERSISIRSITSVQVKLGTMFVPGYINLSYPGGKAFQGGMMAAAQDPDTLIFNRAINAEVEKFAVEINRLRASLHPNSGIPAPVSTADEIAKLAELHKSGALSDDEFSAAKRKALGA